MTPPTAPTGLKTAADAASGPDVRWDDDTTSIFFAWSPATDVGTGVASYTVAWYAQAACAGPATTVAGITGTSYELATGLAHGTTYSFRVTAHDHAGNATPSSCSGAITVDTVPPPDPGLSVAAGDDAGTIVLTLTYGATDDYAKVEIRRKANAVPGDCADGTVIKTLTSGFASGDLYDDTDEAGASYGYRVCAVDPAGNVSAGATDGPEVARAHYVFATSTEYPGDLGAPIAQAGAARADAICETAASNSSHQGFKDATRWRAIISDQNVDAVTRVRVTGAAVFSDDALAFHTRAELWSGAFDAIPWGDELGGFAPPHAWTGSHPNGTRDATKICSNWTDPTDASQGHVGDTGATDTTWLSLGAAVDCDQLRAIYCISQPAPVSGFGFTTLAASGGQVELRLAPPTDETVRQYERIRLFYTGGSVPDGNCSTGTVVADVNAPFATPLEIRTHAPGGGGPHHYRACALDRHGNVLAVELDNVP